MNNDISVNVLSMKSKDVYICRKGIRRDCETNLLLISEDNKLHYTVVKNLSRLLSSSNSKHKHKQYFCNNCLQGFTQELSRDEHYSYCIDNETVRVEMPRKGWTVEFYDGQNQFRVPFMMYVDFEAIPEPTNSAPTLIPTNHALKAQPLWDHTPARLINTSIWLVRLQQVRVWRS